MAKTLKINRSDVSGLAMNLGMVAWRLKQLTHLSPEIEKAHRDASDAKQLALDLLSHEKPVADAALRVARMGR